MKTKLLSVLIATVLALGFVSCGDDEDPPVDNTLYDLSVLKGNYSGVSKVYLTDIKRDTITDNATSVVFSSDLQSTNRLMVSLQPLQGYVFSSNFKSLSNTYTFDLTSITQNGQVGGSIPNYIRQWFSSDYGEDGIEKIDVNLDATVGTVDKNSNKMSFSYTGTIKLYIKNVTNPRTQQIKYEFKDLKK